MVVVESHHFVLAAWAELRTQLKTAPRLLTLDHHTDTSLPFRNYLRKQEPKTQNENNLISQLDFRNRYSVLQAIEKLSNDEHITTAIRSNIISSAFVVAHNSMDTDIDTYSKHKIMCYAVDRKPGSNKLTKVEHDLVLESDFLNNAISSFDQRLKAINEPALTSAPYILDIDLDYFNTFSSIKPNDARVFKHLAKNAHLITIATEPEYVKSCSLEPGLSSQQLLSELKQLL